MRRNHVNIAAVYVPKQAFHKQLKRRGAEPNVANRKNIARHRGFTPEKAAEYKIGRTVKRLQIYFYILLGETVPRPCALIFNAVQIQQYIFGRTAIAYYEKIISC